MASQSGIHDNYLHGVQEEGLVRAKAAISDPTAAREIYKRFIAAVGAYSGMDRKGRPKWQTWPGPLSHAEMQFIADALARCLRQQGPTADLAKAMGIQEIAGDGRGKRGRKSGQTIFPLRAIAARYALLRRTDGKKRSAAVLKEKVAKEFRCSVDTVNRASATHSGLRDRDFSDADLRRLASPKQNSG